MLISNEILKKIQRVYEAFKKRTRSIFSTEDGQEKCGPGPYFDGHHLAKLLVNAIIEREW